MPSRKRRANGDGSVGCVYGRYIARYSYWENGRLKRASLSARTKELANARLRVALGKSSTKDVELIERESRRITEVGKVYFIQGIDGGPIKIGWTLNVEARLAEFQTGSPVILKVLHVIEEAGRPAEDELHRRFAASRLHGEWFLETPELLGFINHQ